MNFFENIKEEQDEKSRIVEQVPLLLNRKIQELFHPTNFYSSLSLSKNIKMRNFNVGTTGTQCRSQGSQKVAICVV
jgi:hypothetical protein